MFNKSGLLNRTLIDWLLRVLMFFATVTLGGLTMAHEGENNYLGDPGMVRKVYDYLQQDQVDSATAYLKNLGDDNQVVQAWINVQCDINNVMKDASASARIGLAGADYCLEKGYKLPAAMILHNVSAFFMPDFDENVDSAHIPVILDAARRQVPLRRDIGQPGPLTWSLWDLGLAELVSDNGDAAIKALEEGEKIALENNDRDAAAWCRLFIGKTKVKLIPDKKTEGEQEMLEVAEVIDEVGQDWEKEAVGNMIKALNLNK